MEDIVSGFKQYDTVTGQIKQKLTERKKLLTEKKALDPDELETARLSLRPEEEKRAVSKIEDAYGNSYDHATMCEAKDHVSVLLGEEPLDSKPRSVRRDLQQAQEKAHELQERRELLPNRKEAKTWER